ncbi:MAG TPA: SgcJ/EcaC family oxidoreductase [Vicinamibacterales bacterium]|jgi:uncharacterized protein (TIGR02246 family)|nr:SgcJ/EcaC family oxidoreductase [Vicinamibacterales bacterium]
MDDETAIRTLIATWHKATAAGDLGTILSLMDEDVVFLTAGRPPMRGRDTFAASFQTVLQGARIESSATVREVHVSGDLAYSWADLTVDVIPRSAAPVHRTGPVLTILRRNAAGGWAVHRDANLLAAADQH